MEISLACIQTSPHCCCCAACFRFGALFLASAASAFSTVIPGIYVSPVSGVLDIELSVSAWYQKTRRALLRVRCLLLLLLLVADSRERERRCFKISCNGAETKERFCANQNTKESRRIQNTPASKINFSFMETPYMDLRAGSTRKVIRRACRLCNPQSIHAPSRRDRRGQNKCLCIPHAYACWSPLSREP